MKNKNKNLFWYGFFANIKKVFGKLLIIFGVGIGLISLILKNYLWIVGIILIICGIVLLSKGHSQRFDYKQQSGYMVHSGDK